MKTAADRLRAAIGGARTRFEEAAAAHRDRAQASLDHDFEHPEEDEAPNEADMLVELSPLDVLELCRAVPKDKRTQLVRDLHKGSAAVLPELARKPDHKVWIKAAQAEELLKLQPPAAAPAPEAPTPPAAPAQPAPPSEPPAEAAPPKE
jgi:hypothetical protein